VDHVVTVARSAACDGDDTEVGAPDDQLDVARPSIVLRFGGRVVVTGGDERSIDHPRSTAIALDVGPKSRCEPPCEISDDAMRLGLRDRKDRAELTNGQVRP
jgi:hypothetical protein